MKKKQSNPNKMTFLDWILSTAILAIYVLIIIGAVSGAGFTYNWLVNKSSFNPEKDICLELKCHYKSGETGLITLDGRTSCGTATIEQSCFNWRSKNKCEINPETEGCVCDEYEQEMDFIKANKCSPYNYTIVSNDEIWGDSIVSGCNPIYIINYINGTCIRSHPQTLEDYNCSVLKKAVLLGMWYDKRNSNFIVDTHLNVCLDCNTRSEIYDVAEAKGCLT